MKHNAFFPDPASRNWIHVIWTTRDAMPRLAPRKRDKLLIYLRKYCEKGDIYLDVAHAMSEHIHLLILLRPRQSLASLVDGLKLATERYLKEVELWESAYHAYSVSAAQLPYLRRQIRRQDKIHLRISLEQELWELNPGGMRSECVCIAQVSGRE
ncbi:MAG: transposase [Bacteroidota bacterium]